MHRFSSSSTVSDRKVCDVDEGAATNSAVFMWQAFHPKDRHGADSLQRDVRWTW